MTSNAENEKRGELAGRVDGRCWAEHATEHDDLRRVAGLNCYKALCNAVDPDHEFSEMELKRYLFGDESALLTNEYLARSSKGHDNFSWKGRPRSNCAAGTAMPPNFLLLDASLPDVTRLVAYGGQKLAAGVAIKTTAPLTAQERVILFCTATGVSHAAVGITAHAMQSMAIKGFIVHDRESGAYALTDSGRAALLAILGDAGLT